jgi:hypothetical protein
LTCNPRRVMLLQAGLGGVLLRLCSHPHHPPSLRATAAAFLADLLQDASNRAQFVSATPLLQFIRALVGLAASAVPRLEAPALRCLGHLTAAAPTLAPAPAAALAGERRQRDRERERAKGRRGCVQGHSQLKHAVHS